MFSGITKFEKARVIGTRATHLSNGAKPKIDIKDMDCVIEIAEEEFKQGKIPITIIRNYDNGDKEEINIFKT